MAQRLNGFITIVPLCLCTFAPFFYLCLLIIYMRHIYNLGIFFYRAIAWLISPFDGKARLWINGQKRSIEILNQKINRSNRYIWIHCASLGEFEQGRPVIESIKKEKPWYKIVLTFFSPSGYEVRKNWPVADVICYLPADTPSNARKFISIVNPEKVIFVKYEFWNNYISELGRKDIPLFLISGIFRTNQHFFRWYGGFFRNILKKFTRIYIQDEMSQNLLRSIGLENFSIAGDTRFDRVVQIASEATSIPAIEQFRGSEKLFLAGSSWPPDEEIIASYIINNPEKMKWVFAPHEIDEENIRRLEKLFRIKCVRFSEFNAESAGARVMIIDNMGMLSSAYRYAYIAAVGGGFGKGIHNILEPACWRIPVLFGPEHKKSREAVDLIAVSGAGSFKNAIEFEAILDRWLSDDDLYKKAADSSLKYVNDNRGATARIMKEIE
ncbi:MAG: 3-deoxy-D-manno-octulosonic acid transferase [Bacteroidia bacterium]|nr:3-deoxy-D-manno-octulosonic acid transferase [Bacteroidia bacterium]